MIAQHGQKGKHNHLIEGRNSRLDGLQAAILLAKLPHLEQWTEARIAVAKKYDARLEETGIAIPKVKKNYRHVFHLYVTRVEDREDLQQKLSERGIETAIHYPTALPFLPCYSHRGFNPDNFPVAWEYQHQILSLPLYPEISDDAINFVSAALKNCHVDQ